MSTIFMIPFVRLICAGTDWCFVGLNLLKILSWTWSISEVQDSKLTFDQPPRLPWACSRHDDFGRFNSFSHFLNESHSAIHPDWLCSLVHQPFDEWQPKTSEDWSCHYEWWFFQRNFEFLIMKIRWYQTNLGFNLKLLILI